MRGEQYFVVLQDKYEREKRHKVGTTKLTLKDLDNATMNYSSPEELIAKIKSSVKSVDFSQFDDIKVMRQRTKEEYDLILGPLYKEDKDAIKSQKVIMSELKKKVKTDIEFALYYAKYYTAKIGIEPNNINKMADVAIRRIQNKRDYYTKIEELINIISKKQKRKDNEEDKENYNYKPIRDAYILMKNYNQRKRLLMDNASLKAELKEARERTRIFSRQLIGLQFFKTGDESLILPSAHEEEIIQSSMEHLDIDEIPSSMRKESGFDGLNDELLFKNYVFKEHPIETADKLRQLKKENSLIRKLIKLEETKLANLQNQIIEIHRELEQPFDNQRIR